jgi:hypothetical protein
MRLDAHFDMLPERAFIKGPHGRIQPQGKGGGGSAPSPDPSIGQAQLKLAELAEQQYSDFKNEIWPELVAQSKHQQAQADKLQEQQMGISARNQEISEEHYARLKEKFHPLQDKLVEQAMDYNQEGNFQRMAGSAMGDATTQNEIARQNHAKQMQAYGINPNSGAFAGINNVQNVLGAANAAAASNRAYSAAQELGWNMGMGASGLGAGLANNQVASTGVALQAGNSALNAGQVPMNNTLAMSGAQNAMYAGAMGGWSNYGNLGAQSYNTQVNGWAAEQQARAQNSAGFGNFLGTVAGAALNKYLPTGGGSDIRIKENISLVGVMSNGIGVYEFEYKPEFKDKPYGGHGRFRGVLAQELQKVNPDAVYELEDGYLGVDYSKVNV